MRQLFASLLLLLAAACVPTMAPPAPADAALAPGNAVLGRAYAQQTCAGCHAIAADAAASPNPAAPAFQQIARTPGMTRVALNAWLHSAHPSMPHLIVDQSDIDNLHAYLESLRQD